MKKPIKLTKKLIEKRTKTIRKKAETVFHLYIKLRDCLQTTGTLTRCRCITCDKIYPFDGIQAGHFYHAGADFDERNLHGQCIHCNKFIHGNGVEYYPKMFSMYGSDVIEELARLKRQPNTLTISDYERIIEETKKKIEYIKGL